MNLVVSIAAFVACLLVAAPRVHLAFDRAPARRRLGVHPRPSTVLPDEHARIASTPTRSATFLDSFARDCTEVSRSVRAGEPVDVVVARLSRTPGAAMRTWGSIDRSLAAGQPLALAVDSARSCAESTDEDDALGLVAMCVNLGAFDPAGLETAVSVLRDRLAQRAELASASAQARLTVRILSWLPAVVFVLVMATDAGAREFVVSGSSTALLGLGITLNACGRAWARRSMRRTLAVAEESGSIRMLDVAAIALRNGLGVPDAVAALAHTGDAACLEAADLCRRGAPLDAALDAIVRAHGTVGRAFSSVLLAARRDGLAIHESVQLLSAEARAQRARNVEAAVRRLPVLLAFPLVVCILPSFLLVSLVPLVASSLGAITGAGAPPIP